MSIWCSWPDVGFSDWADPDEPSPRGGEVRAYANGWSNHHPTRDGEVERPASIGVNDIAPWCVPGHDQEGEGYSCTGCGDVHDHPEVGEWLRLDVDSPTALTWWTKDGEIPAPEPVHASVVLDEGAVRQLVADLTAWLDKPKVRPSMAASSPPPPLERITP